MRKQKTKRPGPLVLTITIPAGEPRGQLRDLCVVLDAVNAAMQATKVKLDGSNTGAVVSACTAIGVSRRGRRR